MAFSGGQIASDPKGYYKLLGVPRCAAKEEINRAYRLLCKSIIPTSQRSRTPTR